MAVLFLTERMSPGYGVPVVVAALARRLAAMGVASAIGCRADAAHWPGLDVRPVEETVEAVTALAESIGATLVVAHAEPFLSLLPALKPRFAVIAHEHGDPTPALFPAEDAARRTAAIAAKRTAVYPHVDAVVAISRFVAADIGWPDAHVIVNGCDHVADPGPKTMADHGAPTGRPLRVGALMRLGPAEARYKGGDIFLELVTAARAAGLAFVPEVMGRGTAADAVLLEAAGITVRRNASDADRDDWLREIDVLVAPSRWEGFNLPLVEAQARGTAAIAFDAGAHAEVAPMIVQSVAEAVALLQAYDGDRRLLTRHAEAGWRHARSAFRWDAAAAAFLALAARHGLVPGGGAMIAVHPPGLAARLIARAGHALRQTRRSLERDGVRITLKRIGRRMRG